MKFYEVKTTFYNRTTGDIHEVIGVKGDFQPFPMEGDWGEVYANEVLAEGGKAWARRKEKERRYASLAFDTQWRKMEREHAQVPIIGRALDGRLAVIGHECL